jgi:hypothetical protein
MASEKQKGGLYIEQYDDFRLRLNRLQLSHLSHCLPPAYFDITFWEHCVWTDEGGIALEQLIQNTLFPAIEFDFSEYCNARCLDNNLSNGWTKEHHKWRNAKCDVLALWSHIKGGRDIFVTSDRNFHGHRDELISLGAGQIQTPEQAALAIEAAVTLEPYINNF